MGLEIVGPTLAERVQVIEFPAQKRFGMDPNKSHGGLLSPTLALRSPASFTHVVLRGHLNTEECRGALASDDKLFFCPQPQVDNGLNGGPHSTSVRTPADSIREGPACWSNNSGNPVIGLICKTDPLNRRCYFFWND